MAKKKNAPVITHAEILTYAIEYVQQQYLEADERAKKLEAEGNAEMAERVRETLGMKSKLLALGKLYEMEVGTSGITIDIDD